MDNFSTFVTFIDHWAWIGWLVLIAVFLVIEMLSLDFTFLMLSIGGVAGLGMDVEAVLLVQRQGQGVEPRLVLGGKLRLGPAQGHGGAVGEALGAMGGGVIVVALHAGRAERPGAGDHRGGVGAIAHQVAQQGKVIGAMRAGVLQAGVQRLAVGVDV